jgi:hypothetical protein
LVRPAPPLAFSFWYLNYQSPWQLLLKSVLLCKKTVCPALSGAPNALQQLQNELQELQPGIVLAGKSDEEERYLDEEEQEEAARSQIAQAKKESPPPPAASGSPAPLPPARTKITAP